jgi:hypothetical protein
MTGTDFCVNIHNQSRSYLNHLVLYNIYKTRREYAVSGLIRYQVKIVYYVDDCIYVSNVIQRSISSNLIFSRAGKFRQRRPVRVHFELCISGSMIVR